MLLIGPLLMASPIRNVTSVDSWIEESIQSFLTNTLAIVVSDVFPLTDTHVIRFVTLLLVLDTVFIISTFCMKIISKLLNIYYRNTYVQMQRENPSGRIFGKE